MRHQLDRRAAKLADEVGADDDLISTRELANLLAVSTQWIEIGRCRHYGPEFTRVGPRIIRYRRSDVQKWLKSRTHACTAEYVNRPKETA